MSLGRLNLQLLVRWHSFQKSGRSVTTATIFLSSRCEICAIQKRHSLRVLSIPHSVRWYSSQPPSGGGGFIKTFVDNLRKSLDKDQEMQKSLKAFESERKKVVHSDSVKLFREKAALLKEWVVTVTIRTFDGSRAAWLKGKGIFFKAYHRIRRSDIGKKGEEMGSELAKTAKVAAEKVSQQAKVVGKTDAYEVVSQGAKAVKEELLDDIIKESGPYRPPEQVLKRNERTSSYSSSWQRRHQPTIQEDDNTKDVVVTRQSRWRREWQKLKENNPVTNLLYSLRMRYDESDNIVIRATRVVTDKVSDVVGGSISQSDMAAALAEINKIDPNFDKEAFVKECQFEIIPTVLEAYLRGNLPVLKDWCHEAAFNVLSAIIKQRTDTHDHQEHTVLEVRNVDIIAAKVLEQGPVMVLAFNAQQLTTSAKENEILENIFYIWALCRDQTIYDPRLAWRVLEFGVQSTGRLLV